jgi:three-Cys-motif partner protein
MSKDIHKSEFDAGTLIKLEILRQYLREWLPVFIKRKELIWRNIFIFDFFAGTGTDIKGNPGSPLIILDELKNYYSDLKDNNIKAITLFNEFKKDKYNQLKNRCHEFLKDEFKNHIDLTIKNEDFQILFNDIYAELVKSNDFPVFMFLDQNGIKHITENVFKRLISLKRNDFMFFISSSYLKRFKENKEFNQYIRLNRKEFDENKPYHCHRVVFDYYKSLIPDNHEYYLSPFSIKKDKNIYGLIFGSNHTLGIEKFLKVCWDINPQTGDANFDIDNEKIDYDQPNMFEEYNIPSKI